MRILTTFQKLLNVDAHFAGDQNYRDTFLVIEGNHVHKGLLYIVAIYGLSFLFITLFQGYYYQTVLNGCLFISALLAYFIQDKGYQLFSKLFNLSILIIVIACMFYFPASPYGEHVNDSVLAFYIPVSVGTLIAFQGKERKYGYLLSLVILIISLLLVIFDIHQLPSGNEIPLKGINYDLLFNVIGAALATFAEVAYILTLNNRLNERLIKANQELDNFVYIVSHDLRSPLLLTKGLLDISKLKIGEKEEVLKYLDLAGKSINNLDDIIKEILTYSRNARTSLQYEWFDLKSVILEIKSGLETKDNPAFSFMEEYSGDHMIHSDKGRLQTVIRNIITNSVKYRKKDDPGAFVKVSYKRTGNQCSIVVSDNGEGIASESLNKVFDMFYRATNSAPGTGLGLYICKEMLEKMGATYAIESVKGHGTSFSILLNQPAPANKVLS